MPIFNANWGLLSYHGLLAVHDVDSCLGDTLHTAALKVVDDLGGAVVSLYAVDAGKCCVYVIAPRVAFVDRAL